jgi:hypothetical protein
MGLKGSGDGKMFERLLDIFKRGKHQYKPAKKNFLQRKDGSVKKPTVVSSDRKGPAQAALPEARSPPLLVQATRPVPVAVSEPAPGVKPVVTLPPDVDPNDVVVVTHEPKKADGERFRYMDKPLKPLGGDSGRSDIIKYVDKKGDVIKYNLTPLQPQSKQDGKAKKTKDDVIKYTPVRVEIKG